MVRGGRLQCLRLTAAPMIVMLLAQEGERRQGYGL